MCRILTILFFSLIFTTPGYCADTSMPDIGAGLPIVTSDQFIGRFTRLVTAIYNDAVIISPQLTLFICIVGGFLGIFWKEARISVLWAIGVMLFILWVPQIIGLAQHYGIIQ